MSSLVIVTNDRAAMAEKLFCVSSPERLPSFVTVVDTPDAVDGLPAGTEVLAWFTFTDKRPASTVEGALRYRRELGQLGGDYEQQMDRLRAWFARRAAHDQALIDAAAREEAGIEVPFQQAEPVLAPEAPAESQPVGRWAAPNNPRTSRWS